VRLLPAVILLNAITVFPPIVSIAGEIENEDEAPRYLGLIRSAINATYSSIESLKAKVRVHNETKVKIVPVSSYRVQPETSAANVSATLRGIFDSHTGQLTRTGDITDSGSNTILVGETLSYQRADDNFWDANGAVTGTAIPMNLLTDRATCTDGKT
jgi:hypothetical protein